ncbi:MAG: hypothetical protein ACRDZX_12590 [Acidimicrobiales bacterium]
MLVGRDMFGGSFVHDPFELYSAGIVSNPNMIVTTWAVSSELGKCSDGDPIEVGSS